jgi:hypothetical protein
MQVRLGRVTDSVADDALRSDASTITLFYSQDAGLLSTIDEDGTITRVGAGAETDTTSLVVDTVADLEAGETGGYVAHLLGYHSAGDGAGGVLYWDATMAAASADGGTSYSVTDPGAWVRISVPYIDPRWFGAKCDGTTDDRTALAAAEAAAVALGMGIRVRGGPLLCGSDITITSELSFDDGSGIISGAGATVTSTGGVVAQPTQCVFGGDGYFALDGQPVKWAHWFSGASTLTPSADGSSRILGAAWASYDTAFEIHIGAPLNATTSLSLTLTAPSTGERWSLDGHGHLITFDGISASATLVNLRGSSHCTIRNLRVVDTSTAAYGIHIWRNVNNDVNGDIILENVRVEGNFTTHLLRCVGTVGLVARDCVFTNLSQAAGDVALYAESSEDLCFENCTFDAHSGGAGGGSAVQLKTVSHLRFAGVTNISCGGEACIRVDTTTSASSNIRIDDLQCAANSGNSPVYDIMVDSSAASTYGIVGLSVNSTVSAASSYGLYVDASSSVVDLDWRSVDSGVYFYTGSTPKATEVRNASIQVENGELVDFSHISHASSLVTAEVSVQSLSTSYVKQPAATAPHRILVKPTTVVGLAMCESDGSVATVRYL